MTQPWQCSAGEIARRVHSGEMSAAEVTEDALVRLAAVNPAINAVVAQMPDEARAAAAQIDAARARGEALAPLAGVPVTVKVNVDQVGHATTNGLRMQRDLIAREDNPVVSNLRRAGAVIIGRTNTPAFSLRWFCRNGLHGHTRNPRDASRTPGGSSGGAAAAVCTGIGAIAHGTDIGGSVRYPAYACGVHGLRPTLGRIPAWNPSAADRHVGAQLMAVSGPLARSVDDVRLGFAAMAARDARDPWWMPVPLEQAPQPRRAALTIAPEGLEVAPEVIAALHDAASRLRAGGWQVDEVECPPLREPAALQLRLWLAEFRRGTAAAIAQEADPDASFIYQQMTEICPAPDLAGLLDTLQSRVGLMRLWQQFLDRYPVLICPVSAELPFPDQLDVESPAAFRRVLEAQLTQVALPFLGLPGLTVSTALIGKIPVGVQLIGGRYREDTLFAAGTIIEAGGSPPSPIDP
jgi:amidase